MGSNQYTAAQFIDAIPGSGGIVSTIARRVGCEWHTARKYIDEHPTVKQAYDNEREVLLDLSESVIVTSIKDGNTQDAKWLLSRMGKQRGYGDAVALTGKDGGPIVVKGYTTVSPDDWPTDKDDGNV